MEEIGIWFPVTSGQYALVDRDIYPEVVKHRWSYRWHGHIERRVKHPEGGHTTLELHRFVLGLQLYDGVMKQLNNTLANLHH